MYVQVRTFGLRGMGWPPLSLDPYPARNGETFRAVRLEIPAVFSRNSTHIIMCSCAQSAHRKETETISRFNMRLTAEDEEILERECAIYGISRAAFVRRAIRRDGVVTDPVLVELLQKYLPILRRDSANMNQSLKFLHIHPNEKKYVEDYINAVVRHEKDFNNFFKSRVDKNMAIIKPINSGASLQISLNYVLQNDKTETRLTSGMYCVPEHAFEQMNATKEIYCKTNDRQFKHFVQSFPPEEEITAETVHEIGLKFAEKMLPGFEVVIATHIDLPKTTFIKIR